MISNKKLLIAGAGVLLLLIIINSTKPAKLNEVYEENSEQKNFDSSTLPDTHKPPSRLNDGEEMPQRRLPMKNFSNIYLKPRFDR